MSFFSILFFFFLRMGPHPIFSFFFFNDTATTEIYTLSLHDALPICQRPQAVVAAGAVLLHQAQLAEAHQVGRSEEHTSELQSPDHLVCRLLLEKKKKRNKMSINSDMTRITLPVPPTRSIYPRPDLCA